MSIFLVGGGPDTVTSSEIFDQFVDEVLERGATRHRVPKIVLVIFDEGGSATHFLPAYTAPLESRMSCEIRPVLVCRDSLVESASFDDVDAILVAGGPTPAYLNALQTSIDAIASAIVQGAPYIGFSAGAMIAPKVALIGGYTMNGTEVCTEEWAEGLGEITLKAGLGVVPFTVDVHAAQAGTLGRALSAVVNGLADRVVAIDENTAVVTTLPDPSSIRIVGGGNAWTFEASDGQVTSSIRRAN
ncbi:Type 1 glutamine amidotransferase-like domain-containing protein [Cryobacterium sp. Y82]|uniref:Type 1 glutamine amidotransferase-like domain-containing protein n=1 Tax=Cryobacterium sp. Y82 TaxID=2045017 RepID=UPI000CE2ED7D|nr:Type 1 glutamine amidotransferase-like domain-containing protein [Cryobacterium sp. Y82]